MGIAFVKLNVQNAEEDIYNNPDDILGNGIDFLPNLKESKCQEINPIK